MTMLARLTGRASVEPPLIPQARLSGPMPWVIAIMVALTVIAAGAGLSLRNAASAARNTLAGGITVQIVEAEPAARARQAEAALARLRETPGIASLRLVPREEVDALVAPWLGSAAPDAAPIPVPALIDAQLRGPVSPQALAQIAESLRSVAPAARVDAQASWLAPVFGAIESLQWLALALVALLGVAMSAAVLLAVRNALGNNRATIEIVHLLGGTDRQIARVFQRAVGLDALGGGVAGLVAGSLAMLALGTRFAALGAGLVDGGALAWRDWLVLGLVPLAAVLLAVLTARVTVLRTLGRML